MKHFAIIGNPIEHSLSPIVFQHFIKQKHVELTYEKILGDDVDFENQVLDFFAQGGYVLNVTLPFKQRAYELALHHTSRCEAVGVANNLWMENNELHADNTDGIGFIRDLKRYFSIKAKKILLLGAGGTARGLIFPLLEQLPSRLIVANRTLKKALTLKNDFPAIDCTDLDNISGEYDLIINTTSASLEGQFITLPQEIMKQKPFCYDVVYKLNGTTPFVQYARNQGCDAVDGLGMLVEDRAEAFYIWNGVMPETESILALLRQL